MKADHTLAPARGSDRLTQEPYETDGQALTILLAIRVLGWKFAPGRFLMEDRRWQPSWRFQPDRDLNDAFRLLSAAKPDEYAIGARRDGDSWCRVTIGGVVGTARDAHQARAITHAVARALGIVVESQA